MNGWEKKLPKSKKAAESKQRIRTDGGDCQEEQRSQTRDQDLREEVSTFQRVVRRDKKCYYNYDFKKLKMETDKE